MLRKPALWTCGKIVQANYMYFKKQHFNFIGWLLISNYSDTTWYHNLLVKILSVRLTLQKIINYIKLYDYRKNLNILVRQWEWYCIIVEGLVWTARFWFFKSCSDLVKSQRNMLREQTWRFFLRFLAYRKIEF